MSKIVANTVYRSSVLLLIICLFPFRFQRRSVFPFRFAVLPFRFAVLPFYCTFESPSFSYRWSGDSRRVSRGPYCKRRATIQTTGRSPPPIPFERGLFAAAHYGQQASAWSGRGYGCGSTTRVHPPSRALASECACQRECLNGDGERNG